MKIALIASPFIPVPPKVYGGTELFIGHLAEGLQKRGIEVVVYCNAESTVKAERRSLYSKSEWPIKGEIYGSLKDLNHTAWAVADAAGECDLIHLNNIPGLAHSRFIKQPVIYTMHHAHEPVLSEFYEHYPDINYVTISRFQRSREKLSNVRTIHHGLDLALYKPGGKREYLSFLGRIAPMKGAHLAIQAAKKAGIPLKIAGEVQPMFRSYFDKEIKPHVDGKMIEYVGEVNLKSKNELLGKSIALLFPIQWDEPFGLVMIEAMACGAPVLALPGGAVQEVVCEGVSGVVCGSVDALAEAAKSASARFDATAVRAYVARYFSTDVMVDAYAALYRGILNVQTPAVDTATVVDDTDSMNDRAVA